MHWSQEQQGEAEEEDGLVVGRKRPQPDHFQKGYKGQEANEPDDKPEDPFSQAQYKHQDKRGRGGRGAVRLGSLPSNPPRARDPITKLSILTQMVEDTKLLGEDSEVHGAAVRALAKYQQEHEAAKTPTQKYNELKRRVDLQRDAVGLMPEGPTKAQRACEEAQARVFEADSETLRSRTPSPSARPWMPSWSRQSRSSHSRRLRESRWSSPRR